MSPLGASEDGGGTPARGANRFDPPEFVCPTCGRALDMDLPASSVYVSYPFRYLGETAVAVVGAILFVLFGRWACPDHGRVLASALRKSGQSVAVARLKYLAFAVAVVVAAALYIVLLAWRC